MDYSKVVKYLDDCLIFGIKPSLVRIHKIMDLMGEIGDTKFIHVVGTNGKTSVTKMVSAILYGQGISCGYHISPHITDYTERFWYKGRDVSQKEFAGLFEAVYPFVEEVNRMDLGGAATQFEIIAAMAFLLAQKMGLKTMVLEAGMGGRWDATNVVDSKVVGLTGVSLEHTQILGDSVEEIAEEKVQVVKKGASSATLSGDSKVLEILKKKVLEQGGDLYTYGSGFKILDLKKTKSGWNMDIRGIYQDYRDLDLHIMGAYQAKNLALAIVLAELCQGSSLKEGPLRDSVGKVRVSGRFELISKDPVVIADASHNPEGIDWFKKNLEQYFSGKRKIIIFAVLKDKDYRSMVQKVAGLADTLIITTSKDERSLGIDMLEKELTEALRGQMGPEVVYKFGSIESSLKYALKIAKSSDIICITGSITNLGHIV